MPGRRCWRPARRSVRDAVAQHLSRRENVSLVTTRDVKWKPLIDHLRDALRPEPLLPDLKVIDLAATETCTREGLLATLLRRMGTRVVLPNKPYDLPTFIEVMVKLPFVRVALLHFDLVQTPERREAYGLELFNTLRDVTMDKGRMALLVQSYQPFGKLLPHEHPISTLEPKEIWLPPRS